jgi:trafficking protein particle complex subunit 8
LRRSKNEVCSPTSSSSSSLDIYIYINTNITTELADDITDPTPYLPESDVTALRTFIRELVAQSIVPNMERAVATWNEQVLARRRGLSGRFMSLSKRWNPLSSSRSSSSSSTLTSNSNYDSLQGFYRPDASEALMRKLADYCFMLRDFKLSLSTYDILRQDFQNDKAWRHYAGAAEMAALSALLSPTPLSSKIRMDNVDAWIEAASYSYTDRQRSAAPYYALRTLLLSLELLRLRGSSAADDAARWAGRILETGLTGPVGSALVTERAAACFAVRTGVGKLRLGRRRRKAALWGVLAAESWWRLDKALQAEKCLELALSLYAAGDGDGDADAGGPVKLPFDEMQTHVDQLRQQILGLRLTTRGLVDDAGGEGEELDDDEAGDTAPGMGEVVEEATETLDASPRLKRKSLIVGAGGPDLGPLSPRGEKSRQGDDHFEGA